MAQELLSGRVAIITGAAQGLGLAIAQAFVAEGASVVLADMNEEQVQSAALSLGVGDRAIGVRCNVTDEDDVDALVAAAAERYGHLDVMVNNAGITRDTTMRKMTVADFELVVDVSLKGAWLGTRAAAGYMREHGGGSIINMSSIAGLIASPPFAAYGFSKAGVAQLTKSVALYCAQKGLRIRCNSIHPGMIQTRMLDGLFVKVAGESGSSVADVRKQFLGRVPLSELGEPDDIANAVLYLASEEAKHVTGAQLVVDGGMTLI
jgi:3-oxoacyl-[acyl-carrier protein] reductase